jgi:ubiquinol-cytochrome c reductase cytochrome b subunit
MGFLLTIGITLQIVSGLMLAMHYSSFINSAYYSVMFLIRDVYRGWYFHYLHSAGSSFIFGLKYLHIGRGLINNSYIGNANLWISGIVLMLLLMAIAFLGYVLAWGHMSFWAGTVITSLFAFMPDIMLFLSGSFYVSNSTLLRFFATHMVLSACVKGLVIIHLFYLHDVGSSSLVNLLANKEITFYPLVFMKDVFTLLLLDNLYVLQICLSGYSLSHPDNNLEVHRLITPSHIIPEWYFLCLYSVLKVIPFNIVGLMLFLLSILMLACLAFVASVGSV